MPLGQSVRSSGRHRTAAGDPSPDLHQANGQNRLVGGLTYSACYWLMGKTGDPGGNPSRHGEEHANSTQKGPGTVWESNPGPSFCEARTLTAQRP